MRPKRALPPPLCERVSNPSSRARRPYAAPDIAALGRIHGTVLGPSGDPGESGSEDTHYAPVEGLPFGPPG